MVPQMVEYVGRRLLLHIDGDDRFITDPSFTDEPVERKHFDGGGT